MKKEINKLKDDKSALEEKVHRITKEQSQNKTIKVFTIIGAIGGAVGGMAAAVNIVMDIVKDAKMTASKTIDDPGPPFEDQEEMKRLGIKRGGTGGSGLVDGAPGGGNSNGGTGRSGR